ncbi:MAG: hypothetical protein U0892_05605 [Pirellulales bacterium]
MSKVFLPTQARRVKSSPTAVAVLGVTAARQWHLRRQVAGLQLCKRFVGPEHGAAGHQRQALQPISENQLNSKPSGVSSLCSTSRSAINGLRMEPVDATSDSSATPRPAAR